MLRKLRDHLGEIVTIALDVLTCALFAPLTALARDRFREPSLVSGALFAGAYLALCFAVRWTLATAPAPARQRRRLPRWLAKLLEAKGGKNEVHWTIGLSAFSFAILFLVALFDVTVGLGNTDNEWMMETWQAPTAACVALVLAFAYPFAYLAERDGNVDPASRKGIALETGATLVADAMLILSCGYFQVTFLEGPGTETIGRDGGSFLITYVVYVWLFASPRFMTLSRRFTWPRFVSGLVAIGVYVWLSLPQR